MRLLAKPKKVATRFADWLKFSKFRHQQQATVLAALVIILAGILGYLLVDNAADTPVRIGYAASIVTIIGAMLAVAIFGWSIYSADKAYELLGDVRDGQKLTRTTLTLVPGRAAKDTEPQDDQTANEFVVIDGVPLDRIKLEQVPIRVFADLIDLWRRERGDGKWAFGDIAWIARKSGQGNHPWLMQFDDDDDIFRVAYGGQSRNGDRGIATRHPAPPSLEIMSSMPVVVDD